MRTCGEAIRLGCLVLGVVLGDLGDVGDGVGVVEDGDTGEVGAATSDGGGGARLGIWRTAAMIR